MKDLISVAGALLPAALFLGASVYFVGAVETFWFVIVVLLLYYAGRYYDLKERHDRYVLEQIRKKKDA